MSISSKGTKLILKSLSTETKWKLVKANSRIICEAVVEEVWEDKRKLAVTGLLTAAAVLGVIGLRHWNRNHRY